MKKNTRLTGTAGEHYVAYKLTLLDIIVAMPREGSPTVDILASNLNGSKVLAIQVKTTEWATRDRGRGKNRKAHHLEFPLGYKSGKLNSDNLIFAFVDLNWRDWHEKQPDIYFIPSECVFEFCKPWIDNSKMVRFHIALDEINKFKNNWELVTERLK